MNTIKKAWKVLWKVGLGALVIALVLWALNENYYYPRDIRYTCAEEAYAFTLERGQSFAGYYPSAEIKTNYEYHYNYCLNQNGFQSEG